MMRGTILAMSANGFSRFLGFYNEFVLASSQNLQFLHTCQFHSFGGPLGERFGDQTWSVEGWLREPMGPKTERQDLQRGGNNGGANSKGCTPSN